MIHLEPFLTPVRDQPILLHKRVRSPAIGSTRRIDICSDADWSSSARRSHCVRCKRGETSLRSGLVNIAVYPGLIPDTRQPETARNRVASSHSSDAHQHLASPTPAARIDELTLDPCTRLLGRRRCKPGGAGSTAQQNGSRTEPAVIN